MRGWECEPFRYIYISDKHLSIVSYCEGDMTVHVYEHEDAYKCAIVQNHKFYCDEASSYAFTRIPEKMPIAQSALEEMPNWAEHDQAVFSSWKKEEVFFKAIEIAKTDWYAYLVITSPSPGKRTYVSGFDIYREALKLVAPEKISWEDHEYF